MRVQRIRVTVRSMMTLVAVVAWLLYAWGVARHVQDDPECRWIVHDWVRAQEIHGPPEPMITVCGSPFWPQYWRKLLFLSWPGSYSCECRDREMRLGTKEGSTEGHLHTYVGSRSVSRDEAASLEACLQSLKSLGSYQTVGSPEPPDAALNLAPIERETGGDRAHQ